MAWSLLCPSNTTLCISCGLQTGRTVPSIKLQQLCRGALFQEYRLHIVVNLVEKRDLDTNFQGNVCDFHKRNSWLNSISWITEIYLYQIEAWYQSIGKGRQNALNIWINLPFHRLSLHYSVPFLQLNPELLQVAKRHFLSIQHH